MNDQERLAGILDRLKTRKGIDEELFTRLSRELDREEAKPGEDEQGRLKIAFYDTKPYDAHFFEECNNGRFALHFLPESLNQKTAEAANGYKAICIFVNDTCDAAVVEQLASFGVELIALRCSGFNNVDLKSCSKHHINVVRVPAYSPYAVAEHTIAMMMTLNRQLHIAYQRNRAGFFVLDGLTGFDMNDKTVGVIGTGKIGQCVINILLGFGCHVLAYDKNPDPTCAAREGVTYVELEALFQRSDVVTLHVPLFPETYHLIDEAAIQQMKQGVMIINTSRGGLLDARALIDGLKSGKIGSAGLDVYEEEAGIFFRDLSDKVLTDDVLARLLAFNNVIVSSHQAFFTREALTNIALTTLANVEEHQSGKRGEQLTNIVQIPD